MRLTNSKARSASGMVLTATQRAATGMHPRQSGFTLLEMIIALVLLGVLASIGGMVISNGVSVYSATTDAIEVLAKQRYALERIARELRQVWFNGGQYAFTTMNPDSVMFTKSDSEQVALSLVGTDVTIGYGSVAGTYTLANNVASLVFTYYEDDGVTEPATAFNVAFVEISLVVQHGAGTTAARTRVAVRN